CSHPDSLHESTVVANHGSQRIGSLKRAKYPIHDGAIRPVPPRGLIEGPADVSTTAECAPTAAPTRSAGSAAASSANVRRTARGDPRWSTSGGSALAFVASAGERSRGVAEHRRECI